MVSSAQKECYQPTQENALSHERIVEKIHLQSPVIPMRFSSLLPGRASVIDFLRNNYQSIKNALERLEGRIEVSLTLLQPTVNGHLPTCSLPHRETNEATQFKNTFSGEEYLLERQRFYDTNGNLMNGWKDIVVGLSQQLYPYWEKIRYERLNPHSFILCLYFLLRKERFEGFLQGIELLRKSHPELKFLFSGPWPPYNFVPDELMKKGLRV